MMLESFTSEVDTSYASGAPYFNRSFELLAWNVLFNPLFNVHSHAQFLMSHFYICFYNRKYIMCGKQESESVFLYESGV